MGKSPASTGPECGAQKDLSPVPCNELDDIHHSPGEAQQECGVQEIKRERGSRSERLDPGGDLGGRLRHPVQKSEPVDFHVALVEVRAVGEQELFLLQSRMPTIE